MDGMASFPGEGTKPFRPKGLAKLKYSLLGATAICFGFSVIGCSGSTTNWPIVFNKRQPSHTVKGFRDYSAD
jgi:hypothetical protein